MIYFSFTPTDYINYDVLYLAPAHLMNQAELQKCFVNPLTEAMGECNVLVVQTPDANAKEARAHFKDLITRIQENHTTPYVFCSDRKYFKFVFGFALDFSIGNHIAEREYPKKFSVFPMIPHSEVEYSHDSKRLSNRAFDYFNRLVNNIPTADVDILTNSLLISPSISGEYSNSVISLPFNSLHQYPELAVDIEAFSLKHYEAGISTISFAPDENKSYTWHMLHPDDYSDTGTAFRRYLRLLQELKEFFIHYKGKLIFHGSGYDVKVLIYVLFMGSISDRRGLMEGFNIFKGKIEDTLLMAYIARNSVNKNKLGLKHLAQEFAGDYGMDDISDITNIPLLDLMKYNATDAISTMYVRDMLAPELDAAAWKLYRELFIPYQELLIYTELCGIPINPKKVRESSDMLEKKIHELTQKIKKSKYYAEAQLLIQQDQLVKTNSKRKNKKILSDIPIVDINLNSDAQMARLIYDVMGIPITSRTAKAKAPSLAADVLEKYLNWDSIDADKKECLSAYVEYIGANKILGTFIKALAGARPTEFGYSLLFGNFGITATISGRLSSNGPNLQNLPAHGFYGDLIKDCFSAPEGWVFGGADFNSLEDYVSALQTKDKNKLKIYLEGYDGHSLRTYYYWPERFTHLEETPESINRIKKEHEDDRQESKAPTFALTYQGTYLTLMSNLGWTKEKAQGVEANFKKLYADSIRWVDTRLNEAITNGYVTLAFGLKLATPALHNSDRIRKSHRLIQEERRSAGNALGQSYCMLTGRASVAFMKLVWADEYMKDKIFPAIFIHDAAYFVWLNEPRVTKFVNDFLIQEMRWQNLPDIQHDQVKIGAELDIFHPSWKFKHGLKNDITLEAVEVLHSRIFGS